MARDPSQPFGEEKCPDLDPACIAVPPCVTELVECLQDISIQLHGIDCILYKQGEELNADPDPRWGDQTGYYPTTRKKFDRLVECQQSGLVGDTVTKSFSFTLEENVIEGTVEVFVGRFDCPDQSVKDDGEGNLTGTGEGSIDYKTGKVDVKFQKAPAIKVPILATYRTTSGKKTRIWIEPLEWNALRDIDKGLMEEENFPLRGYFRPKDEVHSGDWIDLATNFRLGGRDHNQLEVVSRDYKDLRRETLTSYLLAARREHR